MAVDLNDGATNGFQFAKLAVYRLYAANVGTDKINRWLLWRTSGGATTDPLHCLVSAGKDHLMIIVEGPRPGEPNTVNATFGSTRVCFFLGDIVPYFAGDTIPALAVVAQTSQNLTSEPAISVSRNAANNASWVSARLLTLCVPNSTSNSTSLFPLNGQPAATADGNTYLWPYVVVEDSAGMRGRIGKAFFGGWMMAVAGIPGLGLGTKVTYNTETYTGVGVIRTCQNNQFYPFGYYGGSDSNSNSPVVMVPSA
jgi:hypothetical protein